MARENHTLPGTGSGQQSLADLDGDDDGQDDAADDDADLDDDQGDA